MSRLSVGVVEFSDMSLNVRTQIIITKIPEENLTNIFLNQGADVEVGLNRENTEQLLAIVKQAIAVSSKENPTWRSIGKAEFSWSDHADESESGEDAGTVLIESNGSAIRMTFRSTMWDWEPYVTTFSSDNLHKPSALLSRALMNHEDRPKVEGS